MSTFENFNRNTDRVAASNLPDTKIAEQNVRAQERGVDQETCEGPIPILQRTDVLQEPDQSVSTYPPEIEAALAEIEGADGKSAISVLGRVSLLLATRRAKVSKPWHDVKGIGGYVLSLINSAGPKFNYAVVVDLRMEESGICDIQHMINDFNSSLGIDLCVENWKSVKGCLPMIAVVRSSLDEATDVERCKVFLALHKPDDMSYYEFQDNVKDCWNEHESEFAKSTVRRPKLMRNITDWHRFFDRNLENPYGIGLAVDSLQVF
ncbi:MAG: hypothetical protein HQ498_12875 [Pseudohongiella sp.]|nr:hypothetical protein [Pseudohongiella sp.]